MRDAYLLWCTDVTYQFFSFIANYRFLQPKNTLAQASYLSPVEDTTLAIKKKKVLGWFLSDGGKNPC